MNLIFSSFASQQLRGGKAAVDEVIVDGGQQVIQLAISLFLTIAMRIQNEMPFFASLAKPKFAPQQIIERFECYREAVIWCWENRVNSGAGEKMDQALCANVIGLHTPHMSRCVNKHTKAPMNLNPDYLRGFEAFTGWLAASQFVASQAEFTVMEQVIADRKTA